MSLLQDIVAAGRVENAADPHPGLWRKHVSRLKHTWMEASLCSGFQREQETWLVTSSTMYER